FSPGPEPPRQQRGLRTVVHLQLPEDAGDVVLHRLLADEQAPPDLPVRLAGREQLQDLLLARGERRELLTEPLLLALALELAEHAARDLTREHRLPARRAPAGGADIGGGGGFLQGGTRHRP